MSRESERVAIVEYFLANWDDTTYPTKLPNQPFTQPADGTFCHLLIIRNDSIRETIGRRYRTRALGILQFDIYVPVETGSKVQNELEDIFTELFCEKMLITSDQQKIQFQQARPQTFGPKDSRDRICIRVPFYRQFFRTAPQ